MDREIVRRFLDGEGVYAISASFRSRALDQWWGESEKRVEAVLRREMKRGKRP